FIERLHEFNHVRVTVVDKGLHETRNRAAHIAKVYLPKLVHFGEDARGFEDVLPHLPTSFHPGARTKTHANVGAVGDFQSPEVAIEISEDAAGHAAQLRHRRIIRVNTDAHA